MKKLLIAALTLFSAITYAQNHFNGFVDFKRINDQTAVVYFAVTGSDDYRIDEFNEILKTYPGISSSAYIEEPSGYRFKCLMDKNVTAESIKLLLYQFDMKMDVASLHSRNNEITKKPDPVKSREQMLAPHYPDFIDTGNPEADAQRFDNAKQEWIRSYPDEVEKLTGKFPVESETKESK